MSNFRVVTGDVNIGAHSDGFSALFGIQKGGLSSLIYDGTQFLRATPRLTFWRAPTDNDSGADFGFERGIWKIASQYQKLTDIKHSKTADSLVVECSFELPTIPATTAVVRYKVTDSGVIHVTALYRGSKGLPAFPLFGMNFPLHTDYNRFRFRGNGPEENYIDRNRGAKYGVYDSDAQSNLSRYLNPQECGNRTGMEFLEVFDENRQGIKFSAEPGKTFEGGVLPYNEHELESAPRRENLPKPFATWVRILSAQMGVGGDDSWGAPVHDEYLLSAEKDMQFAFTIEKVNPTTAAAVPLPLTREARP
jgi:beta-galactosidase